MNDLELLEALWATPAPTATARTEAMHEAPAVTGIQRQGDLLLIPASVPQVAVLRLLAAVRLDAHPLTVLAGDHAHQVTGRSGATWAPAVGSVQLHAAALGALYVPDGSVAWLTHTGHHAPLAIGPGRYLVIRQRAYVPLPNPPTTDHAPRPAPGHRAQPGHDTAPTWRTVID